MDKVLTIIEIFAQISIFLCIFIGKVERSDLIYSLHIKEDCRNVYNSVLVRDGCNNVYQSSKVVRSYNIFFSKYIFDSTDTRFSTNLQGCKECILCDSLTNQSYCIQNTQYPKEKYIILKNKILQQKEKFGSFLQNTTNTGLNLGSTNCNGSFIINSDNVNHGNGVYQIKNGNNLVNIGSKEGGENIYDCCLGGSPKTTDCYGGLSVGGNNNTYCNYCTYRSSNMYYCLYCESCSYCLGCIGLKNKSFCILNKQYTKEEWFEKANEIFAQMEQDGQLGKFFPPSMNPFYFNDTVAYLIDPSFTKEEVEAEGYLRRDEPIKVDIPAGVQTVQTTELDQFEGFDSQGKRTINDDILKKVIIDESGNAYRIIPMELEFLRKYELPLPRLHWLERIKLGFRFG